jgi:transcriptional repressor NrdR
MRCPWCGGAEDKVVDSRPAERGEAIRRRRQCLSCGRRFTTYERVEELGLTVTKRDGTTEPWDRDKMLAGIRKALVNRPVTEEQVAALATRIETRLRRKGPQVTSQQVGLEVLAALQKLDQVAYVRFASVYRQFSDIEEFEEELARLEREPPLPRGQASLDEQMFDTLESPVTIAPGRRRLRALSGGLSTTTPAPSDQEGTN